MQGYNQRSKWQADSQSRNGILKCGKKMRSDFVCMITERGALVDTFEGNDGGENEDEGQEESQDEDGVEERTIRDVGRRDLDLHQVITKAIFAVARYRYASHAR